MAKALVDIDDLASDLEKLTLKGKKKRTSSMLTVVNPSTGKKVSITGTTSREIIETQRLEEKHAFQPEIIMEQTMGHRSDYSTLACVQESKIPLQPHQLKVVNYIMNNRGLLVVHSVGSGKTLTAVISANCYLSKYPEGKVIIVTPKSLKENVKKEFKKSGIQYDKHRIKTYSYDKFINRFMSGEIKINKKVFLIVDEIHNMRNPKTKRSRRMMLIASLSFKVLLLTATPMINKPQDFRPLFAMVEGTKPSQITPYNEEDSYFQNKISYYKILDFSHYPISEEHNHQIIMDKQYHDKYKTIEKNILEDWVKVMYNKNNIDLKPFYNGIRSAVNRLEYEKSPKINWIINKIIIEKKLNPKTKFLIYSSFLKGGINLVGQRLEEEKEKYLSKSKTDEKFTQIANWFDYVRIDGSMPETDRKNSLDSYNAKNGIKILLISKAGGEGIDLKETRHVIIMEPTWNNGSLNQIKGRAIRYKSHEELPVNQRKVDIWNLYMIKPEEAINPEMVLKENKSADLLLQFIIKEKNQKIDQAMAYVERNKID